MIGEVVQAYADHLRPYRVFPGHLFGRSKMPKSQKMAKNAEKARNTDSTNEYFCGIGDLVKGMDAMSKAWRPCQRLGDQAKGRETMPKAGTPCPRLGNHAQGIETMPNA